MLMAIIRKITTRSVRRHAGVVGLRALHSSQHRCPGPTRNERTNSECFAESRSIWPASNDISRVTRWTPETRTKCLEDWASIDHTLSELVHLQSIDLFCGTKYADSEEAFNNMVGETRSLLPKVETKIHGTYSATVEDGRELTLDLFGTRWRALR